MLGLSYTLPELAPLALAQDLFQGCPDQHALRYVAFDSRQISHGAETLFVALRTPNRDGHDFAAEAYEKGVRNFLVERPLPLPQVNYVLCEDSLESLQAWAMHHRQRFSYPVLGLTGSNGKTIVKEWLATLIEMHFQLVKSPMSYNSQLGVALSLLQLGPQAEVAIIEAGISQKGEMERLCTMVQPTLGILTHMGAAHADGFASEAEKLQEKLQLFESVEALLLGSGQPAVLEQARPTGRPLRTVGRQPSDELQLTDAQPIETGWQLQLHWQGQAYSARLPLPGQAALENATLALLGGLALGVPLPELIERLPLLQPVEMRMELISDDPDLTILNDSYNSDLDSVRLALQQLADQRLHPRRVAILSDIPHLGELQQESQRQVLQEARAIADEVWTVGPVFQQLNDTHAYPDTAALLQALRYEALVPCTLLLKGARSFRLEQVATHLRRKPNATYFQIDLNRLSHNFRWLKSHLPPGVKTMCMVKAASYGTGTWEIAQQLEKDGATYLAVAFASEGIALRSAGISLPIMVMNPDLSSVESLLDFDLEPEVGNLPLLQRYLRAARLRRNHTYRLHLKLETGMGRLGFGPEDLPAVIEQLSQHPDLQVVSVMTHLSAADLPEEDAFSHEQVQRFEQMYQRLQRALGLQAFRHVLNTVGLLRLPQYYFDMVRLGIGLYGIDPRGGDSDLLEIGSLHSNITQIQAHGPGESIGYGRAQRTERPSRIATVPIGYADGIPRSLSSGKFAFLVQGQLAPTFGRICMDMLMLDVTDIPAAQPGDEVVLMGQQGERRLSVADLAQAADTIPYEILVRISPRVRRVYVRE